MSDSSRDFPKIQDTLMSYRNSRRLLKKRIHKLHTMIRNAEAAENPVNMQDCQRRRRCLYLEVGEIGQSIRALESYIRHTKA